MMIWARLAPQEAGNSASLAETIAFDARRFPVEDQTMNPTRKVDGEELVLEDGQISAKLLPFDQETSRIDYQTATFGMG